MTMKTPLAALRGNSMVRAINVAVGVLAIAAIQITQAVAQQGTIETPQDEFFGIRLGMSVASVQALGVELKLLKSAGETVAFYETSQLPLSLKDSTTYQLRFCSDQLCHIEAWTASLPRSGKSFKQGVERYKELRDRLGSRLGTATHSHDVLKGREHCPCDRCVALGARFVNGPLAAAIDLQCIGGKARTNIAIGDTKRLKDSVKGLRTLEKESKEQLQELLRQQESKDKKAL